MSWKTEQTGRRVAGVFVFVLLFTLSVWAKDFWEEKPFTQWDEKQSLSLLSDSPWSRTQTVLSGTLKGKSSSGESFGNRTADLPRIARPGENSGADLARSGINFSGTESIPVYVRWYSSTRVRQALGRLGQLKNNAPEAEVKKFVEEPKEDYLISIVAPLMDAFDQASLESLQGKTFLVSKKNSSKKLMLKSYTAPKDRNDGIALFSFSRTLEGKPAFEPSDEEVQFVTELGKLGIKVSFKLAKMMTDQKLDL